jgi:hypothetical protein
MAGFVALEVLISLAIAGVVLTAMMGFTVLLLRSEVAVEQRRLARDGDWRLRSVLRSSLDSLVLLPGKAGVTQSFSGTAATLQILSMGPRALGLNGPSQFTFNAANGLEGLELRMNWKNRATGKTESDLLEDQLNSVSFDYLSGLGGSDWVPDWQEQSTLPAAIRIDLDSRIKGKSSFVMPLRVDIPAACVAVPGADVCVPVGG